MNRIDVFIDEEEIKTLTEGEIENREGEVIISCKNDRYDSFISVNNGRLLYQVCEEATGLIVKTEPFEALGIKKINKLISFMTEKLKRI
jgi:hypothetical protein